MRDIRPRLVEEADARGIKVRHTSIHSYRATAESFTVKLLADLLLNNLFNLSGSLWASHYNEILPYYFSVVVPAIIITVSKDDNLIEAPSFLHKSLCLFSI